MLTRSASVPLCTDRKSKGPLSVSEWQDAGEKAECRKNAQVTPLPSLRADDVMVEVHRFPLPQQAAQKLLR